MKLRKIVAIVLVCCMVFALAACGKKNAGDNGTTVVVGSDPTETPAVETVTPEKHEETAKPMPTETSDDVELYSVNPGSETSRVVNSLGQVANGYSLDKDGNIVDRDKEPVVAAKNVKTYRDISTLKFSAENYPAVLTAKEEPVDKNSDVTRVNQYPTTVTLILNAGPTDATNGIVVLSSSNTNIAEIRAANNGKIIASGAFEIRSGEIAVDLSDAWTAKIVVTARQEGTATITARALSGSISTTCKVTVKNGEVEGFVEKPEQTPAPITETINASKDPTLHVHKYVDEVVAPKVGEKGYTLHTCECGDSYKDHWTSPIPEEEEVEPHVHVYSNVKVVAPTETEKGYTLHTCECGDSYKDSFVDPVPAQVISGDG